MTIDEQLALIPKLLEEINNLNIKVDTLLNKQENKLDLTRIKNVATYLNCSQPTVYNYINDGRMKQNIHYRKELKQGKPKIVFIESAILEFKKDIA